MWTDLAEMGVLGIGVSEANGGLGMAEVDWVLLAEETGYAALPHPFVETACALSLRCSTTPTTRTACSPNSLDGTRQAGAVPLTSALVPWGDAVTYLVSIDRGRGGDAGWVARRVEGGLAVGDTPEQRRTLAEAVDAGRRAGPPRRWQTDAGFAMGHRRRAGVRPGCPGHRGAACGPRPAHAGPDGRLRRRAQAVRVVIGTQQAVKHHLADAAMKLRFAAPVVYAAAWELSTGAPTASRTVSTAKALASDAARFTAAQALQCHGVIGYTVEYDLHLYLKRAKRSAGAGATPSWHRRRVATALGI